MQQWEGGRHLPSLPCRSTSYSYLMRRKSGVCQGTNCIARIRQIRLGRRKTNIHHHHHHKTNQIAAIYYRAPHTVEGRGSLSETRISLQLLACLFHFEFRPPRTPHGQAPRPSTSALIHSNTRLPTRGNQHGRARMRTRWNTVENGTEQRCLFFPSFPLACLSRRSPLGKVMCYLQGASL